MHGVDRLRRLASVSAIAALGSGAPSTLVGVARRDDLLESTRAAGTMVLGEHARPGALLVAGATSHLAISAFWTSALARILPAGRRVRWGAAAGLAIAAVDLGLIGWRFPRLRALDQRLQVADHIAFGVLVGWALDRTEPVHGGRDGAGTLRAS